MVRPGCASRSLLCAFSMSFFTSSLACRDSTGCGWILPSDVTSFRYSSTEVHAKSTCSTRLGLQLTRLMVWLMTSMVAPSATVSPMPMEKPCCSSQ
jgi:hypothetical protein